MKSEDWDTLSVLFQVKSLTQAAKILYLSQPALSIRLKNMEQELGCQIAIRSNKGLLFTPEGEYLAKQAHQIAALIHQTFRHVNTMQGKHPGTIRLTAPGTFLRYVLLDLLQDYALYAPETKFNIEMVSSSETAQKVIDLEVCGGFINGDYFDTLPRLKVASTTAFAVSKEPISLEQIATMPLIAHNTTDKTKQIIQSWWREQFNREMEVPMNVKNIDICLQMIENGFGFGIVFGDFFQKAHPLCAMPLYTAHGAPLRRDIWFIYSEEMAASPCMRAFLAYLKQALPLAPSVHKSANPGP